MLGHQRQTICCGGTDRIRRTVAGRVIGAVVTVATWAVMIVLARRLPPGGGSGHGAPGMRNNGPLTSPRPACVASKMHAHVTRALPSPRRPCIVGGTVARRCATSREDMLEVRTPSRRLKSAGQDCRPGHRYLTVGRERAVCPHVVAVSTDTILSRARVRDEPGSQP